MKTRWRGSVDHDHFVKQLCRHTFFLFFFFSPFLSLAIKGPCVNAHSFVNVAQLHTFASVIEMAEVAWKVLLAKFCNK